MKQLCFPEFALYCAMKTQYILYTRIVTIVYLAELITRGDRSSFIRVFKFKSYVGKRHFRTTELETQMLFIRVCSIILGNSLSLSSAPLPARTSRSPSGPAPSRTSSSSESRLQHASAVPVQPLQVWNRPRLQRDDRREEISQYSPSSPSRPCRSHAPCYLRTRRRHANGQTGRTERIACATSTARCG